MTRKETLIHTNVWTITVFFLIRVYSSLILVRVFRVLIQQAFL